MLAFYLCGKAHGRKGLAVQSVAVLQAWFLVIMGFFLSRAVVARRLIGYFLEWNKGVA